MLPLLYLNIYFEKFPIIFSHSFHKNFRTHPIIQKLATSETFYNLAPNLHMPAYYIPSPSYSLIQSFTLDSSVLQTKSKSPTKLFSYLISCSMQTIYIIYDRLLNKSSRILIKLFNMIRISLTHSITCRRDEQF